MSFFKQKSVTITTTCPANIYADCKKKGYKFCDLLRLGYQMREKNPALERIGVVEKENEQRKADYFSIKKKYLDLKIELEKMKEARK